MLWAGGWSDVAYCDRCVHKVDGGDRHDVAHNLIIDYQGGKATVLTVWDTTSVRFKQWTSIG